MSPPIRIDFTDNLPANLPRSSRLRLSVELIPVTTAGVNLRSELTPEQWNILRHRVYGRANYCCEACGEGNVEVHCHEVWEYDDEKHIQRLVGLRCLCWECHAATHLTHSDIDGDREILKRLARVNGITIFEANGVLMKAYWRWLERSEHDWKLDTSWLDSYLQKEGTD